MKTIIITGANSGIGKALAKEIIKNGDRLIAICRDSEKSKSAYEEFTSLSSPTRPLMLFGDLTNPDDLNRLVDEVQKLNFPSDLLINNAGSFKPELAMSTEGIEMTMAINVVAMIRLSEKLRAIYNNMTLINITSMMFKKGKISPDTLNNYKPYDGSQRYSDSKQMVVYYTHWLSNQLSGHSAAIAMHPGVVATDVFRDFKSPILKFANYFLQRPSAAAKKILRPFYTDNIKNGYYYSQHKKKKSLDSYVDINLRNQLMTQLLKYL